MEGHFARLWGARFVIAMNVAIEEVTRIGINIRATHLGVDDPTPAAATP